MEYFELILCSLIGLIIGSFVNVCVDRLTLQFSKPRTRLNLIKSLVTPNFVKKLILNQSLSLFHPARSFCFTCGHQLTWFENIPVLSYFLCQGLCRKCKAVIGSKTIWTEMSHGVFFLASGFLLESWIYALVLGICFSFFWFIFSFCYFLRNLERMRF